MSRSWMSFLLLMAASVVSASAAAQEQNHRTALVDGSYVALLDQRTVVHVRAEGQVILARSEAAFVTVSAISDPRGAATGVIVRENWDDGYHFVFFQLAQGRLTRVGGATAPTARIAVADWDGDGDFDVAIPAPGALEDLFWVDTMALYVLRQTAGQLSQVAVSCFPALATAARNDISRLEGEFSSNMARGRSMVLSGGELSEGEQARWPAFLDGLRASTEAPCQSN